MFSFTSHCLRMKLFAFTLHCLHIMFAFTSYCLHTKLFAFTSRCLPMSPHHALCLRITLLVTSSHSLSSHHCCLPLHHIVFAHVHITSPSDHTEAIYTTARAVLHTARLGPGTSLCVYICHLDQTWMRSFPSSSLQTCHLSAILPG